MPMSFAHGVAMFIQWVDLIMSILLFGFFWYQKKVKKRCKFEVLYSTSVGTFTDLMKIFIVGYVPAVFHIEENGNRIAWSRWFGWLITCPVLLIHLSNLPGKEVFNVRRMMKMLIAYQITTCCGITASMCGGGEKYLFIFTAWFFVTMGIFRNAFDIFKESIATMPEAARNHILQMAFVFFHSWAGFGITFFCSPEASGLLHRDVAKALFAYFDIMSKNVYSWYGWYLRWYILRKKDNPQQFVVAEGLNEDDSAQSVRVLVVERDPTFTVFFENILVQMECMPVIAKSTHEAIQSIKTAKKSFDLILVNFNMAKEKDYELMREIRKEIFMLPVIGYGRGIKKADEDRKAQVGIDDFLHAPFPDEDMRRMISKWCRRLSVVVETRASMSASAAASRPVSEDLASYGADVTSLNPLAQAQLATKLDQMKHRRASNSGTAGRQKRVSFNPKDTPEADLSKKLELMMRQLEEVKSTTLQATSAVSQRLERTEHRLNGYLPTVQESPGYPMGQIFTTDGGDQHHHMQSASPVSSSTASTFGSQYQIGDLSNNNANRTRPMMIPQQPQMNNHANWQPYGSPGNGEDMMGIYSSSRSSPGRDGNYAYI